MREKKSDLLQEARQAYRDNPEWFGTDPDRKSIWVRSSETVLQIRNLIPGNTGGHHPDGLALGGSPGQKLIKTADTWFQKNVNHSYVSGLQLRIRNALILSGHAF